MFGGPSGKAPDGSGRKTLSKVEPDILQDPKDDKWYFETYGPPSKPGQTFQDKNESSVGEPGKNTTTMAAATSADPSGFTASAEKLSTAELIKRFGASSDEGEQMALGAAMKKRSLSVEVKVVETEDVMGADHVYVKIAAGGKSHSTGQKKLNNGESHTFQISLEKLAPFSGTISVKVYDSDWSDGDDLLSVIEWNSPFTERSDNRPWDGAHYETKVWFDR